MVNRAAVRRLWVRLHRWLGLGLGLWFVLLGLTGSWLVFYRGIDEMLDPRLAARAATTPMPAMEAVLQALRAAQPQRPGTWRIELPRDAGEVITARYLRPVETAHTGFAPLLASVDPATLQVVAHRFWGDDLSTWLYDLHYSLLLGEFGTYVVGWGGAVFAVSLLSGLWLWWPAPGHLGSALRVKRGASVVRQVYDWHKWSGLVAVPLLGVLVVTGFALGLQGLVRDWIGQVSPLTPVPRVAPTLPGEPRLPVEAAIARGVAIFPGSAVRWIDVPADGTGEPYRLRLRQPGEPGDRFPDTLLWLDAATGDELARRDPARFSAGDTLWRWMHPLHSGQAFGMTGRVLVCASGALPLLLAVTGFLRWRHKRRAKGLQHRR